MSKGFTSYRIGDQNALHYLTFSTVEWIDVFTRKSYKDVLINSFIYCQQHKGLELYSYVIMSNHIHLIASAREGYELSDILRDFKKHTSKSIIKMIKEEPESRREWLLELMAKAGRSNKKNKTYQLWRNDNHPIHIFRPHTIRQKVDYIHGNPVQAGLVERAQEYRYSSAKNYVGESGLLEVIII